MKPWLRFIRFPLIFTAMADVVACALRSWDLLGGTAIAATPLVAAFVSSAAIYVFGMALNDVADHRRDLRLNPGRPLPRGDVSRKAALATVVLAACTAFGVWLALGFEIPLMVPVALGCAAIYDLFAKRWVVPGAFFMGATRYANAAVLVAPWSTSLEGAAPLMHHLGPMCIGFYSAAILVHSSTEGAPSVAKTWTSRIMTLVAFSGAAALSWHQAGRPTLGVAIAFGVCTSVLFGRTPRKGPAKRQTLEMLLGLYLLAYILFTGLASKNFLIEGGGLVVAWGLMMITQMLVRSLRDARPVPNPSL